MTGADLLNWCILSHGVLQNKINNLTLEFWGGFKCSSFTPKTEKLSFQNIFCLSLLSCDALCEDSSYSFCTAVKSLCSHLLYLQGTG